MVKIVKNRIENEMFSKYLFNVILISTKYSIV